MNLIDLVTRAHAPLASDLIEMIGPIEIGAHTCDGFRMRGLRMEAGAEIKISRYSDFNELRSSPRDLNWQISGVPTWSPQTAKLTVSLLIVNPGQNEIPLASVDVHRDDRRWWPVILNWPVVTQQNPDSYISIRVEPSDQNNFVFFGITELVDLRGPIIELAKGNGVEIGPGHQPQIFPNEETQVRYLERSPMKEWEDYYNRSGDKVASSQAKELWEHYIVGDAQRLDVIDDGELDFIFSSHLFEHLSNPLGTLEVWRRKLAKGGKVIGVVPDANNCFDLMQPLSESSEWIAEWKEGQWDLVTEKYEKWTRFTARNADAEKIQRSGTSIHAHYYTPKSFADLLERSKQEFGYSGYHIRSARNNKDFTFILQD